MLYGFLLMTKVNQEVDDQFTQPEIEKHDPVSTTMAPDEPEPCEVLQVPTVITKDVVRAEIEAQAAEYGVDLDSALRIANCESGYDAYAANPSSSAKGVYQFLDSTWERIGAEGHQYDYRENIKQFMIHYPANPGWWVCK